MSSKEKNIVTLLRSYFPTSPQQLNTPHEADSEIISLHGKNYAFNIDDYSLEEDFFSDFFPKRLGKNLITATLSDLLATGATPLFFLHAISFDEKRSSSEAEEFFQGMSEALAQANCHLLGGDTSMSEKFHYTGVAWGEVETPLMRSGIRPTDLLYVSGPLGAGNRQGLLMQLLQKKKLPPEQQYLELASPIFPYRGTESKIINSFAHACIDTSDALVHALFDLLRVNPNISFDIEINQNFLDPLTQKVAELTQVPWQIFLLGSLGEYELLFSIPPERQTAFEQEAQKHNWHPLLLGQAVSVPQKESCFTLNKKELYEKEIPDPRNLGTDEYVQQLFAFTLKRFYEK